MDQPASISKPRSCPKPADRWLSSEIDVTLFRQILLVPFAIEPTSDHPQAALMEGDGLVAALKEQFEGTDWRYQERRWLHLPDDRDASAALDEAERRGERPDDETLVSLKNAYAEFVYFEPYVQRFLFGPDRKNRKNAQPPLSLYLRDDIEALDLEVHNTLSDRPVRICLWVERLNLYLFDTGNAVLAIELAFDPSKPPPSGLKKGRQLTTHLDLSDVLTITERLRRVFPPYFSEYDTQGRKHEDLYAPLYPKALSWIPEDKDDSTGDNGGEPKPAEAIEMVASRGCPPLDRRWRALLRSLALEGDTNDQQNVMLSQMGDDRAFVMSLIGVNDAHRIHQQDWVRLAMADEPEEAAPYSEDFTANLAETHCYDRFWLPGSEKWTTRYLFNDYGYALVGTCPPPSTDGSFHFFRDVLSDHFRRHYFQLALIGYFQKTALNTLSERLSNALLLFKNEANGRFRRCVQAVQQDALRFTHRYWFQDISVQIQAKEIFAHWRRQLQTEPLYEQLLREARETNAFLDAQEQSTLANAAALINRIAVVGLIIASAAGLLGMNVLVQGCVAAGQEWRLVASTFVVTILLFALAYFGGIATDWLTDRIGKAGAWGVWLIIAATLLVGGSYAVLVPDAIPILAPLHQCLGLSPPPAGPALPYQS